MAKKQVIRLTEGDLHNIIKESVNAILENNYKNHINKMKVAKYLSGKNNEETKDEWDKFLGKAYAIRDINRDRDITNMTDHEREFNKYIRPSTFDIDFDDIHQDYYDGDIKYGM